MSTNIGYIKISRAIADHWIWRKAEHLKWWLDLLLMANWSNRPGSQRGQLKASIRYLRERWARYDEDGTLVNKPSEHTIIAFLRALEADGMVTRQSNGRGATLITITNYESYQCFEGTQSNTPATQGGATLATNTKSDGYIAKNGNKSNTKGATLATTINSDSYVDLNNSQSNTNCNTQSNKEEESIYNISSTPSPASACIRTHVRDFAEELKDNDSWRECMCMRHHITQAQLTERLYTFALDCKCNGKQGHESLHDAMSHFNSWLQKQFKEERDEERKCNNRPLTAEEARAKRLQGYMSVLTDPQSFMR